MKLSSRSGSLIMACAVAVGCLGVAATAQATPIPIYYLTTGQTGAQTQIDAFHTTSWTLTAASAWELGGGNFTMKDGGSGTTADTMLSVYQGTDSQGTLEASIDLTVDQFCTLHGGNCQSFNSTPFLFATPFQFTSGLDYYIALTSSAPDEQSQAYFIKGLDGSSILDGLGNVLPEQTLTTSAIPEPMSLAILLTGFAGLSISRKRRVVQ